jgi:HEAT repeat protein
VIESAIQDILYGQTLEVKIQALHRLAGLKEKAQSVVKTLTTMLKDPSPEVRKAIIQALAQIREPAEEVAGVLGDSLGLEGDISVRREVVSAIFILNAKLVMKKLYPKLLLALSDSDGLIRYRVIRLLEKWEAKQAIPEIQKRLFDSDPAVKVAAAAALLVFSEKPQYLVKWVEGPLLNGLLHPEPAVRLLAAERIQKLQNEATFLKIQATLPKLDKNIRDLLEPVITEWFKKEKERAAKEAEEEKKASEKAKEAGEKEEEEEEETSE